jgi:voltage-gated potassium channel
MFGFNNLRDKRQRQFLRSFLFFFLIIFIGTFGYMTIEGWSLIESLYMTIISITTTGFKEVHPLSREGQLFTLFIVIIGFGSIAYTAGRGTQYLFEQELFRRRKMKMAIKKMKNHTIVCGFGRMGQEICEVLKKYDSPFLVIEQNKEICDELELLDYPHIQGNANEDETLINAGINNARALIAVLSSDADNVFAVLTAREHRSDVQILARAVSESAESKLKRAGANKVVLPYLLGGRRIALTLVKPAIMDFIDLIASETNIDLKMEQIFVEEHSELVGLELQSTFIKSDLDIIIVMIMRDSGEMVYNPRGNTVLHKGDKLIAIGHSDSLQVLEEVAKG